MEPLSLRRNCAVAFLLLAASFQAPEVRADPIVSYGTQGGVIFNNSWTTPDPYIVFQGIPGSSGSLDWPSDFPLGKFIVYRPANGASQTFNNQSFSITLTTDKNPPILIGGTINGTLGPNSYPTATIQHIVPVYAVPTAPPWDHAPPPTTFSSANLPIAALRVGGPIALDPSVNGGVIPVMAQVVPVPEPSLPAMFVLVAGGLGLRRFLGRR